MVNTCFTPRGKDAVEVMVLAEGWNGRYATLKGVKMFGVLEGDDFEYSPDALGEFLGGELDFMHIRDYFTQPCDSVNVIMDMSTGIITVYFDLKGVTYYLLGNDIEYCVK